MVCCHGLQSSKNSEKFIAICEELCRAGLAALRFDFTGCGESRTLPDRHLLATRMRDLDRVMDYVFHQPWFNGECGILGSSLGGYLALLAAATGSYPVRGLVCMAAPFDLEKLRQRHAETMRPDELSGGEGKGAVPMTLESIRSVPGVLILHGERDESVPWMDATEIYRRVGEPKQLLIVQAAEHRFLEPHCRRLAVELSRQWLSRRLVGASAP